MAKYQRIAIVVDAVQYRRGMEDGFEKTGEDCFMCMGSSCKGCQSFKPYVDTSHGRHFVQLSDWIVTELDGYKYICSTDKFDMNFQEIIKRND